MKKFLDKTASLTPEAKQVICHKATEQPHSGIYNELTGQGSYLCRRCGIALFRAKSQFNAGCGWPSFDEDILHTVKQKPDSDGLRTEILCKRCDAHLGHVFSGEYLTQKNLRHCVNSLALDFVSDSDVEDTQEAIVAGGCFWGVDYFLKQIDGVVRVEAGYCGGDLAYPRYEEVCAGASGHYEAVRVIYNSAKTDYYSILKRFFEIHDPTQPSGQGPDLGQQYESAVFYYNAAQKEAAQKLISLLQEKGYKPATRLLPVQTFWPAESYHQDYYFKHSKTPYCHSPVSRFD